MIRSLSASGQQLATSDLLKVMNVDEAAFLEAVRRDWTLSDENINMDARTYADGAGKLHVVLPIGSVAGADSYEQVLTLEGIGG